MSVLSDGGVVLSDNGSEGVITSVVGLDVPNLTPAGFHTEEVRSPRKNVGLEIHSEDEVSVTTAGSAVSGDDECTGNAKALVSIRLPGEDTVVTAVSRRLAEEVVDALLDGWVADGLSGVSGVVINTLWADKNGSGTVLSDTTGNVTQVVYQRVRESTSQTNQIVVVESRELVSETLVNDW